jgi:hypothetical protein
MQGPVLECLVAFAGLHSDGVGAVEDEVAGSGAGGDGEGFAFADRADERAIGPGP